MSIRKSFYLVTSLFLTWGFITVLVDSLVPRLREIFELSYFEAGLVQFAFFIAYGLSSIPSGEYVQNWGYKRGIVRGLTIMGLGCVLFIVAADSRWYLFFLLGLFTIAVGMTLLQVGANPYVSLLGDKEGAASRLNIAQGFNSLGTTIAPVIGAIYFLGTAAKTESQIQSLDSIAKIAYFQREAAAVQAPFLTLGIGLFLLALIVRFSKIKDFNPKPINYKSDLTLLKTRSLRMAAIGIFLYVGSEVAIGTYMVNYFLEMNLVDVIKANEYMSSFCSTLMGRSIEKLDGKAIVGCFIIFYWGGAMIGRFAGYFLNRLMNPASVLSTFSLGAIGMILISMNSTGLTAMWSILAVGFFNSVMFPTIFSLGIKDVPNNRPQASGILCTAIAGGAIIPPIFGLLTDLGGFKFAMILLVFCYGFILWSGNWRPLFSRKRAEPTAKSRVHTEVSHTMEMI